MNEDWKNPIAAAVAIAALQVVADETGQQVDIHWLKDEK